jgi:hypothetical protein
VSHQLVESVGAEMTLRHPADGLNVAQAAGARFEEVLRGPEAVGRQRAAHAGEQRLRAREQARLEQGGRDADVGQALALAVVDGAHAVADLEANVPKEGQKLFDVRLPIGGVALRQQHHDVDIRTGVQFAASVAAHGHQRQIMGEFAGVAYPGGAQGNVDQTSTVPNEVFDGFVAGEALLQ